MIDSHCHLDLPEFACDWEQVVAQANAKGVERILIPGTSVKGWERQQMMAQKVRNLDLSYGIHPYFIPTDVTSALDALSDQLRFANVTAVAVGEIGIDGGIATPLTQQQALFEAQLAIAKQCDLPVILHHFRSHHLIFQSLKRCQFTRGGIVHGFSGSLEVATRYIQAGFKLGVGGVITYNRAVKTRNTLASVGLESLVLETDAPDMPIFGKQGLRNQPQYLPYIARALATLQHQSLATIAATTTQNFNQILGSLTH